MELIHLSGTMVQTRNAHNFYFKNGHLEDQGKWEGNIITDLTEVVYEDQQLTEIGNAFSGWLWCYY